jgi:hypothetical protein
MRAKIDNTIVEVEVIKKKYNDYAAEVVIKEGNHKGCYAIVNHKDLINDPKPTKRKISFDSGAVDYRKTTNMFMGVYTYGWKAICSGHFLGSEATKAECKKVARKEFNRLVELGAITQAWP